MFVRTKHIIFTASKNYKLLLLINKNKIMYKKTFKTETKTSKGIFPIEITVWKQDMGDYSSAMRWTFEGFVKVGCDKFPLTSYWKTMGKSHDMMKSLGVKFNTKFKADFSEVISYMQKIDREESEKMTKIQNEYNQMIANIHL